MRRRSPSAAIAGCPVFPAATRGTSASTRCRSTRARTRSCARSALDDTVHPDFGSGRYEGRRSASRIRSSRATPKRTPRRVRVRRRVRPRARTRSRRSRGSRAAATATSCSSSAAPAGCSSCSRPQRTAARWHAGSGAIFNLRSNALRPRGWTSADAAGLPILPGLARYDEVAAGEIRHALRFTVSRTRRAFVFPARHFASVADRPGPARDGPAPAAQGAASTSRRCPRQARIVATALQRYGMLVADNGSDWFISGAPDPRWDNDDLRALEAAARAATSRSSVKLSPRA